MLVSTHQRMNLRRSIKNGKHNHDTVLKRFVDVGERLSDTVFSAF